MARNHGFAAGTLVHTKDGFKPIENICVGDLVLSYPENQNRPLRPRGKHEFTYRKVLKTFVTEEQPLSKLTVANMTYGSDEIIWVTPNHSIFCEDHGGWVTVSTLSLGYAVENALYGNLLVYRLEHDIRKERVYTFEVEEFHTYYVGEEGLWVHNLWI